MSTPLRLTKSQLVGRIDWMEETFIKLINQSILEPRQSEWIKWAEPRIKELKTNLLLGLYARSK